MIADAQRTHPMNLLLETETGCAQRRTVENNEGFERQQGSDEGGEKSYATHDYLERAGDDGEQECGDQGNQDYEGDG